jgi:hypothetical protein
MTSEKPDFVAASFLWRHREDHAVAMPAFVIHDPTGGVERPGDG